MRKQIRFLALTALLSLPASLMAADSNWYNPKGWFKKNNKVTSTTVTGSVESTEDQVIFKTLDGQTLALLGKKASDVGACGSEVKIRVFGNVCQPSEKYPAGAIQVRNFRVIEGNKASVEKTPVSDIITAEPEPYEEPVLETTTEVIPEVPMERREEKYEDDDDDDDVVVEMVDEATDSKAEKNAKKGRTYVVQSGDTLGKISSKVLGTTTKWKKIAEANGITNPKHLRVGMTLVIPE